MEMQLILPSEVWGSFLGGKIWRKGDLPTKTEGRDLDKKALLLLFCGSVARTFEMINISCFKLLN